MGDASRAAKKLDVPPSEIEKEAGNAAFKRKEYQKVSLTATAVVTSFGRSTNLPILSLLHG